ncbi:unnamed protein product, partial [Coregonus sp. 'balchen']
PCKNGGSCRDLNGDFNCRCPSPYVGKHCQLRCISLLGMEGGGIAESQISASSVHYGILGLQRWGPELARLHNKGLINMQRKMRFTGIVTQGASRMGSAEFIKAFKVASMYSNMAGCSEPMGMKSRLLSDRQISASSVHRTWGIEAFTWQSHYARLDKQGKTNAWTAATTNRSEWLQVDLESPKRITGIITQGAKDFGVVQFVSAFKVAYSDDGQSWSIVKDNVTSTDKIFPGNSDNNVHKKNVFEPPFYARFVRILPWAWHERITLRMELLGCDE